MKQVRMQFKKGLALIGVLSFVVTLMPTVVFSQNQPVQNQMVKMKIDGKEYTVSTTDLGQQKIMLETTLTKEQLEKPDVVITDINGYAPVNVGTTSGVLDSMNRTVLEWSTQKSDLVHGVYYVNYHATDDVTVENREHGFEIPLLTIFNKVTLKINGKSSMQAGKAQTLKLMVKEANEAYQNVTWKCSNTKYAKITASGKLTAKKAGIGKTVKITAVLKDGSKRTVTYKVKIKA